MKLIPRLLFILTLLSLQSWSSITTAAATELKKPSDQYRVNVLLVSLGHSNSLRSQMLSQAAQTANLGFAVQGSRGLTEQDWAQLATDWDLILLDGMDASNSQKVFAPALAIFKNTQAKTIALRELPQAPSQLGVTREQAKNISAYYTNGGQTNFDNLMAYTAASLFSLHKQKVEPPFILPKIGFYHPRLPKLVSEDSQAVQQWLQQQTTSTHSQATVAVGIHRSTIELEDTQVVDTLLNSIEQQGASAIAFYYEGVDERQT